MLFALPDIDDELLHDLSENISDSLDAVELGLDRLLVEPSDEDSLHKLFRDLHSIKGNFRVCFMGPFCDLVHVIEEVFAQIRGGRFVFSPAVREITLGAIDTLRVNMGLIKQAGEIDTQGMEVIAQGFFTILSADPESVDAHVHDLMRTMIGAESEALPVAVELPQCKPIEDAIISVSGLENDLSYFQTLAFLLDGRVPYWIVRTERLMGITSFALSYLPYEVDRRQLHAAIYIHDLGMAFVSDKILCASEKLTEEQLKIVRRHPHIGHQLLARLECWQDAALMVLQHHERWDGKGYPNGLKEQEICNGARLLAVADAFCSLTGDRADRSRRRTVLRALMELNNHVGSQFDEATVTAFIKMASDLYKRG